MNEQARPKAIARRITRPRKARPIPRNLRYRLYHVRTRPKRPLSPAREEGLKMPEHIRQEPKVLVSTENLTEQEWLAYRRRGIGGSDVAAILGISPFRTARDLYDDKLNIASVADDAGNWVALEMGHLLEPLVAQIFAKKTGLEVFQIKKMFQHPQYPFMLADVDYFVRLPNGKIAILEIKTTNYNAKDHWWKDGEECVPVYYETQGRHYMAVMDIDEIFYCCLYGNNEDEVIIRHLYRDREYEQEMVYLEREFWHDHILTRIPPPLHRGRQPDPRKPAPPLGCCG